MTTAVVIGAGPAGLRAAEILAAAGHNVKIFEQKRSLGRKFLVAGRGGLNLTHSEGIETFALRYDEPKRWLELLQKFSPQDVRQWFQDLGVSTFIGTSGKVFPRSMRAPAVLEQILERLDRLGCEIVPGHQFHHLLGQRPFDIVFQRKEEYAFFSGDVIVFALGGASLPQTGSDGNWIEYFRAMGIGVRDFIPANVGWERPWPSEFLQIADGKPLKNLSIQCGEKTVRGELLITQYGLEGTGVYQLCRELRRRKKIVIDFKPDLSLEMLRARWKTEMPLPEGAKKFLRLSDAAFALIKEMCAPKRLESFLESVKRCPVDLFSPRPIAEAISSAGGVLWSELDENLMLKKCPGIFCAGEMIDWEAPTGGYLLQGCFVTGTIAGTGAANWIALNA